MEMPSWIKALKDGEVQVIAAEITPVLAAVAERIHYAENRRAQYVVVAAGLFAGAVALASIAVQSDFQLLSWPLGVCACGFFALSVIIFYVYSKQVNRYPWTSATKTWKWFYRNALPNEKMFELGFKQWLFAWDREVVRVRKEFDRQLPVFGESLRNLADPKESLWQDIQQLYVLHVNEKYKNYYLSRLRSLLAEGLAAVLLLSILAWWAQVLSGDAGKVVRIDVSTDTLDVNAVARKYNGSVCENSCWLVNVNARNISSHDQLVGVKSRNADCLMLSAEKGNPFEVKAGHEVTSVIYFSCAEFAAGSLKVEVGNAK